MQRCGRIIYATIAAIQRPIGGANIVINIEQIRRSCCVLLTAAIVIAGCGRSSTEAPAISGAAPAARSAAATSTANVNSEIYAEFSLRADLSSLTHNQKRMLVLLIEASQIMDDLFWRQAYGDDYQEWLAKIGVNESRTFAEVNYGPWDRLKENQPFL
jgi:hypothetical protein